LAFSLFSFQGGPKPSSLPGLYIPYSQVRLANPSSSSLDFFKAPFSFLSPLSPAPLVKNNSFFFKAGRSFPRCGSKASPITHRFFCVESPLLIGVFTVPTEYRLCLCEFFSTRSPLQGLFIQIVLHSFRLFIFAPSFPTIPIFDALRQLVQELHPCCVSFLRSFDYALTLAL